MSEKKMETGLWLLWRFSGCAVAAVVVCLMGLGDLQSAADLYIASGDSASGIPKDLDLLVDGGAVAAFKASAAVAIGAVMQMFKGVFSDFGVGITAGACIATTVLAGVLIQALNIANNPISVLLA